MASLRRATSLPRKIVVERAHAHRAFAGAGRAGGRFVSRHAGCGTGCGSGGLHHLSQYVVQNPAVSEVLELVERVDAAEQLDLLHLAGGSMDATDEVAPRLEALRHAENVVALGAVELETLARGAVLELQREHTHAHEVRAVNALEAL